VKGCMKCMKMAENYLVLKTLNLSGLLQEKEDHLEDLNYQALTKEIAAMIWNHALVSKIMKGD